MKYMNFDTGEVWTEEEIREVYEAEYELHEQYPTFDDYLEHLVDLGKQKVGGIVEIEKWYAVQYDREDTDWGTGSYDLEEAKKLAADNGYKLIAVIDISGDDPVCVDEIEINYIVRRVGGENDGEVIGAFDDETDAIVFARGYDEDHAEEEDYIGVSIYTADGTEVENWI